MQNDNMNYPTNNNPITPPIPVNPQAPVNPLPASNIPQASVSSTPTPISTSTPAPTLTNENVLFGFLGALLGSIIGGVTIILLDRLGFVASVSGVIMAAATIWLYQKFAKGLSKKGIIICIIVMVITTLIAENIACSIQVVNELEKYGLQSTVWDVFWNFYPLIAEGAIDLGAYLASIGLVYVFTAIGSFGIIKTSLGQSKKPKIQQPSVES